MRVAVLGIGEMGKSVIQHLTDCEIDRIIAFDISSNVLDSVRKTGNISVSSNLDTVLADDKVKLVFVTASNDAHKDLVRKSIRAGKSIMCEKPIATTLPDAYEMVNAAEEGKTFLQIGFEARYSKLYTKVKEWIDASLLGRIVNIHCSYVVSEFCGRDSWRVKKDSGGSMVGEKLSHYIDLPRWWVGSDIRDVYAVCAPNVVPYFEVHDNYNITCTHHDGTISHINFMMGPASTFNGDPLRNTVSQQRNDGHELRYIVVGTKGAAQADVFNRAIKRWEFGECKNGFTCNLVEETTWPSEEDHFYFHNTTDQTKDIVHRVSRGLPPKTTIRDAFETMKVCFAVDKSVNEGKIIRIDSLNSKFNEE